MAGNPFRRSVLGNQRQDTERENIYSNGVSPWGDDSFGNDEADIDVPPRKPGGKKKRVTIQTPPHSPEEAPIHHPPRRLSEGRADSPPPQDFFSNSTRNDVVNVTGPTAADEELRQAAANTWQNVGHLPPSGPSNSAPAGPGSRAPYNPFARTLATTEAAYDSQKSKDADMDREEAEPRPVRRGLDVDAFKNILLTGSAVPSPPPGAAPATSENTVQFQQSSTKAEKTASQDHKTSSEPTNVSDGQGQSNSMSYFPHSPSSPSSRVDDYDTESESESEVEDSSLMGPESRRPEEIAPTAPPKNVPQTVSFADFDNSFSPSSSSPFPDVKSPSQPPSQRAEGLPRPGLARSTSDLNKPLPVAPTPPSEPQAPKPSSISQEQSISREKTPTPSQTPSQQSKRPPPPPPASRRQGQANSGATRPRSASNNSTRKTETETISPSISNSTPVTEPTAKAAAAAPPPPPSRRTHGSGSGAAGAPEVTASPSPMASPPISSVQSPEPQTEKQPVPNVPPPPPRRAISKPSTPANRTPSSASRTSTKRPDSYIAPEVATPTGNNSHASGPPVPPPRRGAGKRDSAAYPPSASYLNNALNSSGRRPSAHSVESEGAGSFVSASEGGERASIPNSKTPNPTAEVQGAKVDNRDILADMSAFQAEIDALRAQGQK